MPKYIVGIDEVGRGSVAGPVAVGIVVVPKDFDWKFFRGIKDSKKLSQKEREKWLKKVKVKNRPSADFINKAEGKINFCVSMVGNEMIDKKGISFCIKRAISRSLNSLNLKPNECRVLLDGGLKAPEEFIFQKTIIKGDEKIKVISCASVLAKVRRDKLMERMARIYPKYGFEGHKGYGTKLHFSKIKKHGLTPIHRRSFLGLKSAFDS